MEFHEIRHFRVGLDLLGSFSGLSPGGTVPRWFLSSSFPGVSPVFGRMASFLVADETFAIPDMFRSVARGEIDFVYIHGIWVRSRGSVSWWDVAVPFSSEFPELYHISVELSGFVKPLLPLPTGLSIRKGGGSHHDSELLGYSSLEGVY